MGDVLKWLATPHLLVALRASAGQSHSGLPSYEFPVVGLAFL
jgi:hypothetical protein